MPKDPPDYLHEEPAGSWREKWYTGTGFPKVYYLRYHMYRHYFPVIALARFARLAETAR
jgi:squalene-hopene/tetraprenyl-beta-curcumene cyclase